MRVYLSFHVALTGKKINEKDTPTFDFQRIGRGERRGGDHLYGYRELYNAFVSFGLSSKAGNCS
jgi:hypothetical protein